MSKINFVLFLAIILTSNNSAFGFSALRTKPLEGAAASSSSSSSSSSDSLQSLLDAATHSEDMADIAGAKLGHHQLQHLMEHSMTSPLLYGGKPPPRLSSTALKSSHHDDYLPQTSMLRDDDSDRPVYDPGDELIKNYNSDEPDYMDAAGVGSDNNDLDENDKIGFLRKLEEEIRDEQEFVSKTALMMQMLEDPSIETLPMVYVEEPAATPASQQIDASLEASNNYMQDVTGGLEKRSRYYRRYPWKRHSSRNRGTYEADARYLCVPSKEDVFKLLVGLHENRNGNHHKTVNFCNRKRPAKTIFTNIRFLG